MNAIEHTFISLLADVATQSGYSEIRGSYLGLQWCLNEAPKLEKQVLDAIENNSNVDLECFPDCLRRLVAGSLVDPVQLRLLRQLLLFCYKASVTHDIKTTEKAFENFEATNRTIGSVGSDLARVSPALLNRTRQHVQSVLFKFRPKGIVPSHGPGAVTTSKEKWKQIYPTIEACYPYSDWFSLYYNEDHLSNWDSATHKSEIIAKLIAVPKDTRGPRLICVHPAEAVWIQQGVRRELERVISLRRSSKGPWPCGHIFFDDQSVNAKIALFSSKSGRYATIDMKEASDRISEPLVQILFGRRYKWFGCCRAQKYVTVGSKESTDIHSYAPMGNATTFPVQSLIFWAICVSSLQYHGFHQPGAVYVFGDDIIIPSKCARFVIDDLESFGLLVNRSKTFYRGAFRESCGTDAFKGVDVTPVRWKTTIDAEHLEGMQSLSDLAMRLRVAGYEEAAVSAYRILRRYMLQRYGARLFFTNNLNHGGIAEYISGVDSKVWMDAFWHPSYQWFYSPILRLKQVASCEEPHGWNHVLESILTLVRTGRSSIPDRSVSRLTRLVRGWIPVK